MIQKSTPGTKPVKTGLLQKINDLKPGWYLVLGLVLTFLTHMNFGIGILAWIGYVPFILYLQKTSGIKSRCYFSLVLILTWCLIVLKIITTPIPPVMSILFGIPIGLMHTFAFLVWSKWRKHTYWTLLFPIALTLFEWLQYTFTPLASWGVAAYTQADNITMIQSVSLLGMPLLSFAIYWINASVASLLLHEKVRGLNVYAPVILVLVLTIYGHFRYNYGKSNGTDTIQVAAIGTESTIGGLPLPEWKENESHLRNILKRSVNAAKSGAKLIVWTEASCFLTKENELTWQAEIGKIAKEYETTICASYVVPFTEPEFHYENKYLLFLPDGSIDHTYLKHEPVPGEPAIKGTSEQKVATFQGVKIGGAICYDYDFPYIAREIGNLDADVVALPSSDWRGIDPIHTKMAAFRAIEQGHSIVRSTRFGLSAAINPYGEMVGYSSSFNTNHKILLADLPISGQTTLYQLIGDAFVYLMLLAGIGLIGLKYFKR